MKPTLHALRVVLHAVALATTTALLAQTIPPMPPGDSGPVVKLDPLSITGERDSGYVAQNSVSASKMNVPLLETPMSVQVVPAAIIADQGARQLGDVLRNVSGVQSMYSFGGMFEGFVVRGFLQSNASYRNGIRVPLKRFELANAERVEVLKGPAATLYGSSDPGGLVNVVTQLPASTAHYAIEQRFGSFDNYRTEASATGPLSDDGKWTYRLDAAWQKAASFRELIETERTFIAPALSWQPSANTRFNFSVESQHDRGVYDVGVPAVGDHFPDLPIGNTFTQPGMTDRYRNLLIDLNGSHRLSPEWLLSGGLFSSADRKQYYEIYQYASFGPTDRLGDRYFWAGPETVDVRTAWVNLAGDFATGKIQHRLLFGAERTNVKSDSKVADRYLDTIDIYTYRPGSFFVDPTPIVAGAPDFINAVDAVSDSLYVQDQMRLTEQWQLVVGARHDWLTRKLDNGYYSPVVHSERSDGQTSPRIGAVYQASSTLSLYANYSTSFGPGFEYEIDTLGEPETARQGEVGVKLNSVNGRLISTLSVFELTKRNILTPDPNNPMLKVPIGEARSRGVEFDVQGRLTDSLSLIASYAYTDSKITRDHSGNQGHRTPYAPRHQGSLWLNYAFTTQPLKGLSLSGGVFAASERYGDAENSFKDGGYARIDLAAAYRFRLGRAAMTAQLNVTNVNDARYYYLRARWTNLPSEPRAATLSLRAEF